MQPILRKVRRSPAFKAALGIAALTLAAAPAAYLGTMAALPVAAAEPALNPELLPSSEPAPPVPWQSLAESLVAAGRFTPDLADQVLAAIWAAAEEAGRDPWLDVGLVVAESDFNPLATSPAGARGLYQLMPGTAAGLARELGLEFHPDDLYQPLVNIRLGTYLLAKLYHTHHDWHRALTAYNRGEAGLRDYVVSRGTARSHYSERVLELRQDLIQQHTN